MESRRVGHHGVADSFVFITTAAHESNDAFERNGVLTFLNANKGCLKTFTCSSFL